MKKYLTYLMCLIAGAILPLAFAPKNIWILAVVALVALIFSLYKANSKQAFGNGFCFGFGMFGVGASWIYVSIHDFGYTSEGLAALLTCLFVFVLALFIATMGYVLNKFIKSKNFFVYACISFPCIWVIFELIISVFLTGFPWLLLGYSQTEAPLSGYAPIGSVYLISYLIALSAGLISCVIYTWQNKHLAKKFLTISICAGTLTAIWVGGIFLQQINWTQTQGDKITVGLLQGNISPDNKFLLTDTIATVDKLYGKMTRDNIDLDLIIWPENAIPMPYPQSKYYFDYLKTLAKNSENTIIVGVPIEAGNNKFFNSLIAINDNYKTYSKSRLVPFGEFVPLERYIRGLIKFFDLPMSDFIPGSKSTPTVFNIKQSKILPLICYEIAYSIDVQTKFKDNPEVLITISEDGWFGKSWGPHQHLAIAKMRALETSRYVLRATSSGISAIISPQGKIIKRSNQFKAEVLTGEYYNMAGKTIWSKIGIWPLLVYLTVVLAITAILGRYDTSRK